MDTNRGWNTGLPKEGVKVRIRCDNWTGEYESVATRKAYAKPKPGQCKKGFMRGWRWIDENGETLSRKDTPNAWLPIA